jgi:hypothetical protein
VVKRALVTAGIPAIREPPGLDRGKDKRGKDKRPDGMTLVPWQAGKALVWDVTCVDTMAMSYITGSITAAGSAAETAEKKKIDKYKELVDGRYIFGPLAFETFGAWGPACKDLLSTVGRKIANQTGEKRSFDFLKQRISIEIQRGNAACVLGTHTFDRGLDEIFYVLNTKR